MLQDCTHACGGFFAWCAFGLLFVNLFFFFGAERAVIFFLPLSVLARAFCTN